MGTQKRASLEPTRLALEYALDLLGNNAKAAVIQHLETKCSLSLYNSSGALSRDQVRNALVDLFEAGALLFLQRFDEYMRNQAKDTEEVAN
jgi:hypothetical protein